MFGGNHMDLVGTGMAAQITIRPWGRSDRRKMQRWPTPIIPPHWVDRLPDDGIHGVPVSYAICNGADLVGRLTLTGERLGIYLRPDCYGRGYGRLAIRLITTEQPNLWLEVASDNRRAIRCYLAAGFTVDQLYARNGHPYVRMIHNG